MSRQAHPLHLPVTQAPRSCAAEDFAGPQLEWSGVLTASSRSTERRRTRENVTRVGRTTKGGLVLADATPRASPRGERDRGDGDRELSGARAARLADPPEGMGDIALNPRPWMLKLRGGRPPAPLGPSDAHLEGAPGSAAASATRSCDCRDARDGSGRGREGSAASRTAGWMASSCVFRSRRGISSLSFDAEDFGSFGRRIRRETVGWSEATDRLEVPIAGGVNHFVVTGADGLRRGGMREEQGQ
jgi:hypothetical protein